MGLQKDPPEPQATRPGHHRVALGWLGQGALTDLEALAAVGLVGSPSCCLEEGRKHCVYTRQIVSLLPPPNFMNTRDSRP